MTQADIQQVRGGAQPELQAVFLEESNELLDRLDRDLVAVEHADSERRRQLVAEIKRHLHTLKGAASALGVASVKELCHQLEEAVPEHLDGEDPVEASALDDFHRSVSKMRSLVEQGGAGPGNEAPSKPASEPRDEQRDTERAPTQGDEQGKQRAQPDATDPEAPQEATRRPARRSSTGKKRPSSGKIRVASEKLETLQAAASELVVLKLQQEQSRKRIDRFRDQLGGLRNDWRGLFGRLRELRGQLPASRWQTLQEETSRLSAQLKEAYQTSYELSRWSVDHAGQLGRVSQTLEEGLRSVRMQPLGPFFDRFGRVIRDAARNEDKKVRLETQGRDIEVDRAVLEKLYEPLLHLVRNAVAHGIETPEARRRRQKPEVGQVRLEATLSGDEVYLCVGDDGGGLDLPAIRERAVEQGLLRPDEAIDSAGLVALLTHPGFSTRTTADEVSGRGVGLDVVDAVISELGGELAIDTEADRGTTFELTVPTSITTSKGLILRVGPYELGLQLQAVERILEVDPEDLEQIDGHQVLRHEGEPVAITSLAALIDAPQDAAPADSRPLALILHSGSQRLAVTVDDIPGQIPMVIKPLGDQFEGVHHLNGGAIRADGSVLPVLEHRELLRRAAGRPQPALREAASAPKQAGSEQPIASSGGTRTILVVDDSMTTRTLERNILEGAGYRVLTATDGAEALQIIEANADIDLVVTDLEMPRVNGFELCRRVRQGRRPDLPVIIVTSKGSESEQQQGMEAGADAYIVKGNFKQEHFLTTVERFVL